MENPRKKEFLDCPFCGNESKLGENGNVWCINEYCDINGYAIPIKRWNTRPAMSTWLEGEVPTVEEIKKVIINECCDAIANDGVDSIVRSGELAQAIHALLTRKLTGKV